MSTNRPVRTAARPAEVARQHLWTRRRALPVLLSCAVLGCLGVMASGCAKAPAPAKKARRTMNIDDLPAPIIDAAKKALPDVEFNDAWGNVDASGTVQSYEVRGRNAEGKIREVRVSLTGEILEME